MLTSIAAEVYSAMELFVMDGKLKDLIETMLEGDLSGINLNQNEADQKSLIRWTGFTERFF
jgi:hypothetical protein